MFSVGTIPYSGTGVLLRCPVCALPRRGCVAHRPRTLAQVASSATDIKIRDTPLGYPVFWYATYYLIQGCKVQRKTAERCSC